MKTDINKVHLVYPNDHLAKQDEKWFANFWKIANIEDCVVFETGLTFEPEMNSQKF
jgi:hypothetical protein